MAEVMGPMQVQVTLICDNFGPRHLVLNSEDLGSDPTSRAAADAAQDAAAELLSRTRKAGWLVDLESGRVLCPACSGQAGGGE